MSRLKFTLLNLTATLIEYIMIFLLSYYLIRKQDLMWSLIDVGIILFIGLIIIFLTRSGKIVMDDSVTEEDIKKVFDKYKPLIEKAIEMKGREITLGVIKNSNIHAPALETKNYIYVNLAYPVKSIYMDGLIAHELGHAISGFTNQLFFTRLRLSIYLASMLKYFAGVLRNSKRGYIKAIRYIVFIPYVVLNTFNYFVLFPYMKREEHIANAYAIKLGAGDSLRCYYYSNMNKESDKLDLFDQVHPSLRDMIKLMNEVSGYKKDYEVDVYGVNSKVYYVDNFIDKDEKNIKIFNWYLNMADPKLSDVQSKLGFMYLNGVGTDKDFRKAISWYNKSVKNGLSKGYFNIAYAYEQLGKFEIAMSNYEEAIVHGVTQSYMKLGSLQEMSAETLEFAYETYYKGSVKGIPECIKKLTCTIK